jgi:hypothetical membrane protein
MNSRYLARMALAAVVLFLILLAALHFLEPEFDPSKHLISEYELGRYGWMMALAFFSLGVGVLAMLLSTWYPSTTGSGLIGRWWFLAIGIALFGAGIFYPYTTPNIASYIHGICGVIVIATFPIAATLYSSGLAHSREWSASRGRLPWATLLVWVGLLSSLLLDSRVLCDQQLNERTKQRLASLADVVHKLEKTQIQQEFLL